MTKASGVGLGWCESKQVNCSSREQCETARTVTEARIETAQPTPSGLFEKIIFAIGQNSPQAYMLNSDVDVKKERARLKRFDLLLARNCGADCIVESALDTFEFRDLISATANGDESSTMQPKTLEYTTEELK